MSINADPGDLVVIASVAPNGAINEFARYVPPETPPVLTRAAEETVLAWVIHRRELVGPDGVPISDEMLAGMRLSVDGAPQEGRTTGLCGRCAFEDLPNQRPNFAPAIVNSGDRCSVPEFAEVVPLAGDRTLAFDVAVTRKKIFFEWPGACACTPYAIGEKNFSLDAQLLELTPQIQPIEAVAQAANGDVAVLSRQLIEVISPAGAVLRSLAELPFVAPIFSAVSTPDGGFIVASHDEDAGDTQAKIFRFTSELSIAEMFNLPIRPEKMRWLEGRAILLGQTEIRDDPRAMVCVVPGAPLGNCGAVDRLKCEFFTPTSIDALGGSARDALVMDNGMLVVEGIKGFAYFERTPDPTMSIAVDVANGSQGRFFGTISDCAGAVRWAAFGPDPDPEHEFRRLFALGDHLLVCMNTAGSELFEQRIDRSVLSSTVAPPALHALYSGGGPCGGFSAVPECPGAVRIQIGNVRKVYALDAQGDVVERQDCTASEQLPSIDTSVLVPGYTLSETLAGNLYLRDDRAPAPEFRLIHGSGRSPSSIAEVFALEDRFLAFQQTGEVAVVELGADRRSMADARWLASSVPGLEHGERITSIAPISDFEYVGAVFGGPLPRFLRIAISGEQVSADEYPVLGRDSLGPLAFRRIVAVGPEIFVLITSEGTIFLLRDGLISEVQLLSDGPIISPNPFECLTSLVPSAQPERDVLRDASSAGGVAWVVGCDGTLYRVHPYSEPAKAVRLSLTGSTLYAEQGDTPPSLISVRAQCADSVLFAARGTGRTDWEQGRLFEVLPGIALVQEPTNRGARGVSLISSESPAAIAGTAQWATMSFYGFDDSGSMHIVGDPHRFWINDALVRAVAHPAGGAVLAGSGTGRLIFGTVSPR